MTAQPASAKLTWLLNDLLKRSPHAQHVIVLSADGLPVAWSDGFDDADHEDAKNLAAVAAGIQSLAKGAGTRFDGGPVKQTIVEMTDGFLLVTAAGPGACLAALAKAGADVGQIAYEMNALTAAVGEHLSTPARGSDDRA
ncbi:roadblock/LC7 domain-containing protein [Actinomadura geliboluensis]|uniref:roadblock/LC7 domain-containing protein n=1 Tax=Actinomadura geliboluensis TaxID=882440 RepID=UPI003723D3A7